MTRRLFNLAALLLPWMRPKQPDVLLTPTRRCNCGKCHCTEIWTLQDGRKQIFQDGRLVRTVRIPKETSWTW